MKYLQFMNIITFIVFGFAALFTDVKLHGFAVACVSFAAALNTAALYSIIEAKKDKIK